MQGRRMPFWAKIDSMEGDGVDSDDLEIIDEKSLKRLQDDLASDPESSGDCNIVEERVAWSDDEDGTKAYKMFQERKSRKRKRQSTADSKPTSKGRPRKTASTGVGLQPRKDAKLLDATNERATERVWNEASASEDDQTIDAAIPEHIKGRKRMFEDKRKSGDKFAALALPPSFEDIDFSDDERLVGLREKPNLPHLKPCNRYDDITLKYSLGVIPAPIAQWLREYQVTGASFLHELFVYQKGGILGDDMGLGKTIQVIAALTAAFGKTADERDDKRMRKMRRASGNPWYPIALIICPGGLMENWKNELNRWGWWHIDVYHGNQLEKDTALDAARHGHTEIMITTYTTYRMNKDAINMVEWDCVIADECHIIKEKKAMVTEAMNEVNSLCRIGLTGTAIQNKYDELWTLLNWTNPGRFGPMKNWKTVISDPLKIGQSHDATNKQLSHARKTAKKLVENLLPEFFLRRMKSLIADQLPKKSDRVVFCPLTTTQANAYEEFIMSDTVEYIKQSIALCECGSGKKRGWCCHQSIPGKEGKWTKYVFPAISTLQKLANHLALLIPSSNDSVEKQEKALKTLKAAVPGEWQDLYRRGDHILTLANAEFCGKWKILQKLLEFWYSSGDKVLVFSHSVRLLKTLQALFSATTSYNVSYLDGAMSYAERARVVDDYNADPGQFVFLISTRAGGVGLNITSANKVVVVDPNWNPAHDLQAQDRAYRIGQLRDVEVFRLISAGTIEEIVYARQIYKQQQANVGYNASMERRYFKGVQDQKDQKGEIFGLGNLFAFQNESIVLQQIVNKLNVAESRAGVNVVGLDVDSTQDYDAPHDFKVSKSKEDDDPLMSQLADVIARGEDFLEHEENPTPVQKPDAIQAILKSAGVEYTHENSEVVGSSKIEVQLSRRAEEASNDITMMREHVFAHSQSQVENQLELADNAFPDFFVDGLAGDNGEDGLSRKRYRYNPSVDVRRRQFANMAKTFDFDDITEFALVVEGWTQAQRRACLDKFYAAKRLGEVAVGNNHDGSEGNAFTNDNGSVEDELVSAGAKHDALDENSRAERIQAIAMSSVTHHVNDTNDDEMDDEL